MLPNWRVKPIPTWPSGRSGGASFVAATTAERDRQLRAVADGLRQAESHVAAWDYPAAIQSLEALAEPLRNATVTAVLQDCIARKSESDGLIASIAERVRSKELDGLLPLVERAVTLRGDRKDLVKIRSQLAERRDGRVARARAALDAGDARAAAAAFVGSDAEDFEPDATQLIAQVRRLVATEDRIVQMVKDAKADARVTPVEAAAILEVGKEYLAANPKNEQIVRLVAQCQDAVWPVVLRNSIGIELKRISAGSFVMGEKGSGVCQVTLTKPFYIGVYEVTNAQWKRVMGTVPSQWPDADRPVEQVSWDDANEFCRKLSALPEEQQAGRVYRLPTEAEWEYACRAGTTTEYCFGDAESGLGDYGWFAGNSGGETHPVGQKKPNAWGLFDMHGNVEEWCSDLYGHFGSSEDSDSYWVSRGGRWSGPAGCCRTARRDGTPSVRIDSLGFRLALSRSGEQSVPPEAAAGK
jgi:formylglycine-generating enzyme required for sulfatase activity